MKKSDLYAALRTELHTIFQPSLTSLHQSRKAATARRYTRLPDVQEAVWGDATILGPFN